VKKENQSPVVSRQTDFPVDRDLPGFPDLLSSEKVHSLIASRLASGAFRVDDCRIEYLRYKPFTNCIIAYRLGIAGGGSPGEIFFYAKLYSAGDYEIAAAKAASHRWTPVAGFEPVLALPEYSAILYFFPNDCLIDGLRVLSTPKKLQRILYEHYDKFPESQWRISDSRLRLTTVRYKPERRAVLRCDTKAVHREKRIRQPLSVYLRIYADDRGSDVFSLQEELYRMARNSGVFSVPRPLAYIADRKLLLMETLRGDTLPSRLGGNERLLWISRAAIALAAMHQFNIPDLPEKLVRSYIEEAAATRETLLNVISDSARQSEEIFDILKGHNESVSRFGLVHGDFYHGQILCDENSVSILDFDRSYAGDVISDVGNFLAHLRLLSINGELQGDSNLEAAFLKAYEGVTGQGIPAESLNFWIAFGLFQLSVGPFRRLEQGWRAKTRLILGECLRILKS